MISKLDLNKILLKNGFLEIPLGSGSPAKKELLMTIISNLIYFGYVPSKEAFERLKTHSHEDLVAFWEESEVVFKNVSFTDRDMDSFIVYKNFPLEVMNMSESEYWFKQILIYYGVPSDYLREDKEERPELNEIKNLKVLSLSNDNTFEDIFNSLVSKKAVWNDYEKECALTLLKYLNKENVDVSEYGFKENAILMARFAFDNNLDLKIKDATDVLRLVAVLSDGCLSYINKVRFKNFKKSERVRLLSILDSCNNLKEDFAMRKEVWKKFMYKLHAGDYKFENVNNAVDLLYKNKIKTFNSTIENKIANKDSSVLELLESRHGDFVRRFHKLYEVFGLSAIKKLDEIVYKFETIQILKLKKYVTTINDRNNLIFAPKGNWSKAKIIRNDIVAKGSLNKARAENITIEKLQRLEKSREFFGDFSDNSIEISHSKVEIKKTHLISIVRILNKELKLRMNEKFPEGISLDLKLKDVKLASNSQSLDVDFGRGTKFDIPENCKTIRTSSYWKAGKNIGTCWFDNSWNFFNEDWKEKGSVCWNSTGFNGALFSGDPLSGADSHGRACQVIDLDIDKLVQSGVRYCVWNILCFSELSFNEVEEVLGTLQFAEDSLAGEVFEPSRMHLGFPLKGDNLTKYVAYVDLVERKLIYMDANFNGNVKSANLNGTILSKIMPPFLEYLDTLPSVYDLFETVNKGKTKVLFSDTGKNIKENTAYVFKRENKKNDFENIEISNLLK